MIDVNMLPQELREELGKVGVKVHPNREFDIPELKDTSIPEVDKRLDWLVGLLTDWYIITDSFDDHLERDRWINDISKRVGKTFTDFYLKNKFRFTWYNNISHTIEVISFDITKPLPKKLE